MAAPSTGKKKPTKPSSRSTNASKGAERGKEKARPKSKTQASTAKPAREKRRKQEKTGLSSSLRRADKGGVAGGLDNSGGLDESKILKASLKARGLSTKGSRQELRDRLASSSRPEAAQRSV
jgi:hypothetical protein